MQYDFSRALRCLVQIPELGGYGITHTAATIAITGNQTTDYPLRSKRDNLQEGSDYIKSTGSDRVTRIYYSVEGVIRLCEMINSERSLAFKEALLLHVQPKGALVQQAGSQLYSNRPQPAYQEAYADSPYPGQPIQPWQQPGYLQQPPQVAAMAFIENTVDRAVQRAIETRIPQQSMAVDQAMLQQQQLRTEGDSSLATALLAVLKQTQHHEQVMADKRSNNTTVYQASSKVDSWLNNQDGFVLALLGACMFALVAIGAYFMIMMGMRSQQPSTSHSQIVSSVQQKV